MELALIHVPVLRTLMMASRLIWRLLPIALCFYFEACSSNSQLVSTGTRTVTGSPTEAHAGIEIATVFFPTSTPAQPERRREFAIEDILPEARYVDISRLGLGTTTIILAQEVATGKIVGLSASDAFSLLPVVLPEAASASSVTLSPDRRRMVFQVRDGQGSDAIANFDLWTAKADGRAQSRIVNDVQGGFSFDWLGPEKLLLWWGGTRAADCPNIVELVDVGTGVTHKLTSVYEIRPERRLYCFPRPILSPDAQHSIVLEDGVGWQMIDYQSGTAERVLHGVVTSPSRGMENLRWNDDGVSYAFQSSDGITYALGLTLEDLLGQASRSEIIYLPAGHEIADRRLYWWDPLTSTVAFRLRTNKAAAGDTLVIGNLETGKLLDYHLDMAVFRSERGIPSSALTTQNAALVGWSVQRAPDNHPTLGSVVLNTQTGYVSFLDGLQLLGFGEMDAVP